MAALSVSGLSIYPVKSCREIIINSTDVEYFGLKNDRRWMVVDEYGVMLTQRKVSKMCLIQPKVTETGIILQSEFMDALHVKYPFSNKKIKVKVWADECPAYDSGDSAATWLSEFLSIKCRLVYFPDNEFRQVDLDYANEGDKTAFSDGFPLLLISQESLNDLNSRLIFPVRMNRFRPNIIINGCNPYEEDLWKKVRIGEITYRIVKPCSRCVIPNINIDTAEREEQPIKELAKYRKRNNKIFFGQNVIASSTGKISVGMGIEVIE